MLTPDDQVDELQRLLDEIEGHARCARRELRPESYASCPNARAVRRHLQQVRHALESAALLARTLDER
jgi:hypothetical protein